ncbi:MAG TPA: hypothetical protein PLV42_04295 [bacterium]|nr:hypothetical protein [bacterium]
MRRLIIAALLWAPLYGLYAEKESSLKSTISVERGVYKKGWEYDFFRDILPADGTPNADTVTAIPDETVSDTDTGVHRRTVVPPIHRKAVRKPPIDEPSAVSPPPENEREKEPEPVAPPPAEELLLPSRRPEPEATPPLPQKNEPQKEMLLPQEPADPKKKQKERARELDRKRKKGNFRDPKITY